MSNTNRSQTTTVARQNDRTAPRGIGHNSAQAPNLETRTQLLSAEAEKVEGPYREARLKLVSQAIELADELIEHDDPERLFGGDWSKCKDRFEKDKAEALRFILKRVFDPKTSSEIVRAIGPMFKTDAPVKEIIQTVRETRGGFHGLAAQNTKRDRQASPNPRAAAPSLVAESSTKSVRLLRVPRQNGQGETDDIMRVEVDLRDRLPAGRHLSIAFEMDKQTLDALERRRESAVPFAERRKRRPPAT